MMTTKKQTMLDEFKESYILKKANEIAQDYEFIKGFTINRISEYMHLLSIFLKENKKELDIFFNSIKNKKNINNNILFKQDLNLILNIPKLIRKDNNEFEVDYVFLEKNFLKIEKEKEKKEIRNSLNELEKEFKCFNSNLFKDKSSFNLSDLYKFGQFILNFITNIEVRKEISKDLLNSKLESNNKFEETFNQQFIQKQKPISTWNSNQGMRI